MKDHFFKVKVNGDIFLEIQDSQQDFSILSLPNDTYHAIIDHESINAKIVTQDFNARTFTVSVFGKLYEVYIGNPLDDLIEKLGLEMKEILRIDELKAPMPGLIIESKVKAGDTVREGDALIILKAMKMENTISSPRDGIIKSVEVAADASVEKDQLLIVFEKTE